LSSQSFECVLVHLLTHEGILLKKLLIRGRLHNWIYRLKAHSLGLELSILLRDRITSGRHSGNHIVDPNVSLENLSIYCRHEPVSYLSREIHISDTSDFTIEHFMRKISDMAFVKPPSFSAEKEYRFSFTIVAGEMILMPTVKNVILKAEHLVDWTV
uniref:hypothetical protein n=1 Tax=Aeromonas sp. QDB25 TaxID=2989832 RepID=UPI0022E70164